MAEASHEESLQTQAIRRRTDDLGDMEAIDLVAAENFGCDFHEFVVNMEVRYERNRYLSLAKTAIEEAIMWTSKGITHAVKKAD